MLDSCDSLKLKFSWFVPTKYAHIMHRYYNFTMQIDQNTCIKCALNE